MVKKLAKKSGTRKEFIEDAIHELRAPLSIMKGTVDMALKGSRMKPDLVQALTSANEEIRNLSGLLSDLTLLIREDHGRNKFITLEKVNLPGLIKRILKRFLPLVRRKKIKLKIKQPANVSVLGNKMYLERLFINLIGNAVYYAKTGSTISVGFSKSGNNLITKIQDSGVGIPKKDLPKIFDRFYRVKKIRSASDTGMGLGLAIVKSIAKSHRGDVSVESVVGKGTTFAVSLPLA